MWHAAHAPCIGRNAKGSRKTRGGGKKHPGNAASSSKRERVGGLDDDTSSAAMCFCRVASDRHHVALAGTIVTHSPILY